MEKIKMTIEDLEWCLKTSADEGDFGDEKPSVELEIEIVDDKEQSSF